MENSFTDNFGRLVSQNDDGSWQLQDGSVHLGPCQQAQAVSTFDGMAPEGWTPPAPPPPTTIAPLDFIRRFTPAEMATLNAANPIWGLQVAAAGTIDITDPTLLADIAAAVSAGALTQARATQVLNLAVASP